VRPFHFLAGGPLGSGRQWFPWIHYADEIGAIVSLLNDASARGPYNLCAAETIRNKDFARAVGRELRRPWWWPAPAFALRALFGDMADALLLASAKVHPLRLRAAGYAFEFPSAEGALKDLLK
jgi:NAD dependent epimerase/dehydratase family enzyme